MTMPRSGFLQRLMFAMLLALCLPAFSATPASAWEERSLSRLQPLADKGNAEAQYFMGMFYGQGIGGANEDPKLAWDWFQKSAAGGDPLGAYKVGSYYAGLPPGLVAADADKAFSYKLFAAKAGYALAQTDIANIYYKAGDYAQAEKWWKLAADQGEPTAANNLSALYSEDNGAPRNLVKSYAWFKIAYSPGQMKMRATAQEFLDKLVKDMKPADIAAAEKQASRWKAKPTALTTKALTPKLRFEAFLRTHEVKSK